MYTDSINRVLDYIEEHLTDEISYSTLAGMMAMSVYEFRRIFAFIIGTPLSDYIRLRRLSMAVFDLQDPGASVTDIAVKYHYDSPSSFSRAFRDMQGMSPTEARQGGSLLRSFPRASLSVTVSGASGIEFRLMRRGEMKLCGHTGISDRNAGDCGEEIWNAYYDGGYHDRLAESGAFAAENAEFAAYTGSGDSDVNCTIGALLPADAPTPDGMEALIIPPALWGVFDVVGTMDCRSTPRTTRRSRSGSARRSMSATRISAISSPSPSRIAKRARRCAGAYITLSGRKNNREYTKGTAEMNDVILITGGSDGYGKAAAKRFAEAGCRVVITGRRKDALALAAEETGAIPFAADATIPEDWERLGKFIREKFGRLDLLVNNAGGGVAIKRRRHISRRDRPRDKAEPEQRDIRLPGVRPDVSLAKGGTIINVSSVCAKEAWPGWSVYAAAKWGVLGFTKGLATELAPDGVRVTCLVPGAGDTSFDKNAGFTGRGCVPGLKSGNIADTIFAVYNLPGNVWVEEITVWGIDQVVIPL